MWPRKRPNQIVPTIYKSFIREDGRTTHRVVFEFFKLVAGYLVYVHAIEIWWYSCCGLDCSDNCLTRPANGRCGPFYGTQIYQPRTHSINRVPEFWRGHNPTRSLINTKFLFLSHWIVILVLLTLFSRFSFFEMDDIFSDPNLHSYVVWTFWCG